MEGSYVVLGMEAGDEASVKDIYSRGRCALISSISSVADFAFVSYQSQRVIT